MNTEDSTETDFPISPERMKWPFRCKEEQQKIIKWRQKQKRRDKVNELNDIELAPY
jgi:hypothetical protein